MRRGITPVVAVALLMGMTVVASGGAYTFFTQATQSGMAEASASLSTELAVRSMRCADTSAVVGISNTGDRELNADTASVFLYRGGELLGTMEKDLSGADVLQPGGFSELEFPFTTYLSPGTRYTVEVRFPDADYTVERTCQGRTGDLVGYWPFDTIESRTILDAAGDHDATFNNMALNGTFTGIDTNAVRGNASGTGGDDPVWTSGCHGDGCLDFDGTDDIVETTANRSDLGIDASQAYTVTAWLKPDDNTGWKVAVGDWSNADTVHLGIDKGEDVFSNYVRTANSGQQHVLGSTVPQTGRWSFVAATVELGSEMKIYVDGELEGTTDLTGSGGFANTGSTDLVIGDKHGGTNLPWDGSIDEVRVYDRALSQAEVAAVMDGDLVPEGLAAYYPMDEGSGQDVWNNAFQAEGMHGQAVRFDGADDRITVDAGSSLPSQEVAVSAWVYLREHKSWNRVVSHDWGSVGGYLLFTDSSGNVYFRVRDGSMNQIGVGDTIPLNEWTHVTGVYDGTAVGLYVDGESAGTAALSQTLDSTGGIEISADDGTNSLNGSLDDIRIYDRALSASEVQDDMQGGAPKDGIVAYYSMDGPTGNAVWNDAFWQEGKHGGALHTTDAAEHAVASPTLGAVGGSSFSIALWANEHNDSGTTRMPVLFRISDADNDPRLTVQRDRRYGTGSDYIMFQVAEPDGSGITLRHGKVFGTGTPLRWENETGWHHVVGVRDAQDGEMRLYVDGTLQDNASDANISAGLDLGTNDTYLGNQVKENQAFDGVLDDVRLYGSALSAEQVRALYNATN